MYLMSESICYNSDLSVKAYGAKIAECQKSNLKMHQLIIETDWKEITDYYGLRAGDEACLALWSALDYFFGDALLTTRSWDSHPGYHPAALIGCDGSRGTNPASTLGL